MPPLTPPTQPRGHAPALLITRPEPGASRLADVVRQRLHPAPQIVLSPLMRAEPVGDLPDLSDVARFIVTSPQGATRLAALTARRDIPCAVVGQRCAAVLRAAGFALAQVSPTAEALLCWLGAHPIAGCTLHVRGAHVSADLVAALSARGAWAAGAIVYRQTSLGLTAEAADLLARETAVILPLYSTRSARLFFGQGPFVASLHVVVISAQVAAHVSPHVRVVIAGRPDGPAMEQAVFGLWDDFKRLEGRGEAH